MTVSISNRGWAIIVLGVITAVIHLSLGGTLFILNGLGYLALLAVIFAPVDFFSQFRTMGRWALLGYTILTFILYFVMNPNAMTSTLGLITKAVEVVLAVLLFMDLRS